MLAPKILTAAAVAALLTALSTLASAKPTVIRSVDLSEVLNKTVCPIRVEIDEDQDRVPRRIKMMKCAAEPSHWCRLQHVPPHECCQHHHGGHRMECVEMRDTVLVYYKSNRRSATLEVAVGCSCMIEQTTRASPLPAP